MTRIFLKTVAVAFVGFTGFSAAASAATPEDIRAYSACIIKRAGPEAQALLATTPASDAEGELARKIANRYAKCLDDTNLPQPGIGLLRGGIAEELITRDPARLAAARALAPSTAVPAEGGTPRQIVVKVAQCLVASNPQAAVNLVTTMRDSFAEREAIDSFGDALKSCVHDGGAYQFVVSETRNHVADVLYRMTETGKTGS